MNTISPLQIGFNHRLTSLTHTAAAGPVDRFQASAEPDFLHPRSVAVVGGTTKEGKPGNTILTNLLKSFQGETHIVNTRAAGQQMLGKPVYGSVKDIPDQVDLAVITVPGQYVQGVIEDCAAKGVKNAIVISAGFSETHDMEARAAALKKTAADNGIRVMGPNCLGLINTAVGLNVSFASTPANPGSIAMLSQSGGVMISMLGAGQQKNFGFSTLASLGNKMDLQESDFLKLLESDDNTRVVSIYTEGIKDGRRFLETAAQTSKRMPVLVLKGGRSASGAQAASSHTGSLAGQSVVFDAAMRKAGVIQVHDEEHMADLAMAFAEQPLPAGRRLTIVTNGGGPGIIATDNATEKNGLELSKLDPSTGERLLASLPDEGISVKNPIDIRGDAGADLYKAALEAALQDPNTDMAMVILVAASGTADGPEQVAKAIADLSQKYDKPVVASFMGGQVTEPAQAVLRANRIPVYPTPSRGTRALGAMADYAETRASHQAEETSSLPAPDKARAKAILDEAQAQGRKMLSAQDCIDLFEAYQIPVVKSRLSQDADASVKAADEIGYPVVMKLASQDIVHKKDVGGVILNLNNADEVRQAHAKLLENLKTHRPDAKLDGIQVMEQASFEGAREIIAGLVHDPTFGATLMTGLGGTYVEVFKDVKFGVAPVSPGAAGEMLSSLQAYKLLEGTRGEAPSDISALTQVLARVSELGHDFPQIKELDINPFLVYQKGVRAVDGRVTLASPERV